MTPSLLLLVPAVGSAIGLPILGAPRPSDIATGIQQLSSRFATETASVLTTGDAAVIDIVRMAYLSCLLVGALLYYTRLERRRLGKDMIMGGVLLLVMAEFIVPAVVALSS